MSEERNENAETNEEQETPILYTSAPSGERLFYSTYLSECPLPPDMMRPLKEDALAHNGVRVVDMNGVDNKDAFLNAPSPAPEDKVDRLNASLSDPVNGDWDEEKGGLLKAVSFSEFINYWRDAGARIGTTHNGEIVWEQQGASA